MFLAVTLAGIVLSFFVIMFCQRPHHTPARFAVPVMIFYLLLALMEIVKLALWGSIVSWARSQDLHERLTALIRATIR